MTPCRRDALCRPCAALLDERGEELFEHYRKKLLVQGWAGQYSPVERRYVQAHRSEARQLAAAGRARNIRRGPVTPAPDTEAV